MLLLPSCALACASQPGWGSRRWTGTGGPEEKQDVEAYKFEMEVNYKPIVGDDVGSNDESLIGEIVQREVLKRERICQIQRGGSWLARFGGSSRLILAGRELGRSC